MYWTSSIILLAELYVSVEATTYVDVVDAICYVVPFAQQVTRNQLLLDASSKERYNKTLGVVLDYLPVWFGSFGNFSIALKNLDPPQYGPVGSHLVWRADKETTLHLYKCPFYSFAATKRFNEEALAKKFEQPRADGLSQAESAARNITDFRAGNIESSRDTYLPATPKYKDVKGPRVLAQQTQILTNAINGLRDPTNSFMFSNRLRRECNAENKFCKAWGALTRKQKENFRPKDRHRHHEKEDREEESKKEMKTVSPGTAVKEDRDKGY